MDFTSFNLDPSIMEGLKTLRYVTPTPIQEKAIPVIMQGKDLIGLAQTGTGKTAAFVLPILHRLINSPRGKVRALIVSPTRELAEQTVESINVFTYYTGLRGVSIYGGVSMYNQVESLKRGAELVVACPGRLLDHMMNGTIDLSLLEVLVIDEADRMFDMGFLPDIRNIVRCLPQTHQTLLFSATMPPDIRRLVQEVLHDPVTIQIGTMAPVDSVSHALYPVKPHLKVQLLKGILKNTETDSVVVFTRTKHRVERVADALRRAGFPVAALQGDMEQRQRQNAIEGFKRGDVKILVATDIAARGLDILSITHVINFDMPDTTDAYIHRIGRTGRVNNKGDAFTLVTGEDKDMIRDLEKIFKKPIETRRLEGFDYEAPDVQGSSSGRQSTNDRKPSRRSSRVVTVIKSEAKRDEPEVRTNNRRQASPSRENRVYNNPRPHSTAAESGIKPVEKAAAAPESRPPVNNRRPAMNEPMRVKNSSRTNTQRQTRRDPIHSVSRVRYARPEEVSRAQ